MPKILNPKTLKPLEALEPLKPLNYSQMPKP